MKSLIITILLITLMGSTLQKHHSMKTASKHHDSDPKTTTDENSTSEKKSTITTEPATTNGDNKDKNTKKNHIKRSLRMNRMSNKDIYAEIKEQQDQDQALVNQLEKDRLVLIENRRLCKVDYDTAVSTANSYQVSYKQVTIEYEELTVTLTSYESQLLIIEKYLITQETTLTNQQTELKRYTVTSQGHTDNVALIRGQIEKKNEEIQRIKDSLVKAENEKKDLEAQLAKVNNQITSTASLITTQTTRISETTGCITKKRTEKETLIIQINTKKEEINKKISIKREWEVKIVSQDKVVDRLKLELQSWDDKILLIQAQISDLKMRICKHYKKDGSVEKTTKETIETRAPTETRQEQVFSKEKEQEMLPTGGKKVKRN